MAAPLLVIGLDGATWDLVEPWAAAGRLPVLAGLMARGAHARLASTHPPATFPAWTSLVTGVNPGRHAVLDFAERVPGTYRVRFVNGSQRRTPALWTRLTAAGRRSAILTVPATYPPEPIDGLMVSGWDTPLTTAADGSFVHPRDAWPAVRALVGGRLPFADFQEVATGDGWHARALASLLDGIRRRTALATGLLRRERWDALMVVFGESDTVAHHFWRFHDPRSPRFAASAHGDAVARVYAALDAAVGEIVAAAPRDAVVGIVSDHGSGGAGDRVVHLHRRLADVGLLGFRPTGGRAAAIARRLALRALPAALQGALLRRLPAAAGRLEGSTRVGNVDWSATRVFADELDYAPALWVNLEGREPEGIVPHAAYEATRDAAIAALSGWRDEAGRPVVARVRRREEVYAGPATERAPDLLVELALVDGYSPSCLRSDGPGPALRRLAAHEHGAGKGAGMSGAHRRDGLLLLAGPGVRAAGRVADARITDVLPTLLALAGLPVPDGLDGRPLAAALATPIAHAPDDVPAPATAPVAYDAAGAREMAARLEALGYLEPGA